MSWVVGRISPGKPPDFTDFSLLTTSIFWRGGRKPCSKQSETLLRSRDKITAVICWHIDTYVFDTWKNSLLIGMASLRIRFTVLTTKLTVNSCFQLFKYRYMYIYICTNICINNGFSNIKDNIRFCFVITQALVCQRTPQTTWLKIAKR